MDTQQPKKEYDKDNYVATMSTVVEKVANLKESQDNFHREMKESFRDLKNNYSDRINKLEDDKTDKEYTDKVVADFESRMRVTERFIDNNAGEQRITTIIVSAIVAIIVALVISWLKTKI